MDTISASINVPIAAIVVPGFIVLMILFGLIGHIWAGCYVASRNNGGSFLGAIFGLLVAMTIGGFLSSVLMGLLLLVITLWYLTFAMRLQRGY